MKNFNTIKNMILCSFLLHAESYATEIEFSDHETPAINDHQERITLPKIKFTQSHSNPGDYKGRGKTEILEFSVDPYSPFVDQVEIFLNTPETKSILCPTFQPEEISLVMNNLRLTATKEDYNFLFSIIRPAKKDPENPNEGHYDPNTAPLGQESLLDLNQVFTEQYVNSLYYHDPKYDENVPPPTFTPEEISQIINKNLDGNIWNVFRDPKPVTDFSYRFSKQEVTDRVNAYNRWISYSIIKNMQPSQKTKSARNVQAG